MPALLASCLFQLWLGLGCAVQWELSNVNTLVQLRGWNIQPNIHMYQWRTHSIWTQIGFYFCICVGGMCTWEFQILWCSESRAFIVHVGTRWSPNLSVTEVSRNVSDLDVFEMRSRSKSIGWRRNFQHLILDKLECNLLRFRRSYCFTLR